MKDEQGNSTRLLVEKAQPYSWLMPAIVILLTLGIVALSIMSAYWQSRAIEVQIKQLDARPNTTQENSGNAGE